jgi:hypothetical protein
MRKRFYPVLVTIAATTLCMQPALADKLLIGAKGGIQGVDFEELGKADSSLVALISMGYEFTRLGSMNVAAELEISSSLDKGEVLNRDFNLQNSVLYLSLRGDGSSYFIGKIGVAHTEVDFVDFPNMDDTGAAISIGMGFGKLVGLELELTGYSYQEMGTSAMLSAGWRF